MTLFSDPSEIESTPSAKTVIEGNNASFYCNATGKPEPIITWVKHGSQTVLDQGERFSINNISRQQDGNYKCSAWNNVGHPAIANFSITVHCKYSLSLDYVRMIIIYFVHRFEWWLCSDGKQKVFVGKKL